MSSQNPSTFWTFVALFAAAYAPSICWLPALGVAAGYGLPVLLFSPVCLAWLLWDHWFPLMPYGPDAFWLAGIFMLLVYLIAVWVLSCLVRRSRVAMQTAALVLFCASLAQGLAFLSLVRGLAG